MLESTLHLTAVATQSWDAVVVGAGPAGSLAARELARLGRSVLLVDRATFPRWKVCGCCLNGSALGTLAAVGLGDLPERLGAIPLTGVTLAAGGRQASLRLPAGVALSREAFDVALIREAIRAGAAFRQGTTVRRATGDELELIAGSESVRVQPGIAIAADGLNGQLTALSGERSAVAPRSRIGAGVVVERAPKDYVSRQIFMAVGRGGYVGLVRLEDGRLDVAAAFDPEFVRTSGGLGTAASAVLAEAGFPAIADLAESPWRGTPLLTRRARQIAGERWYAIGDAAGYVEPFTGEGMAWALASGVAVAPLVARDWSPSSMAEWESTHRRLVRSRQTVCRIVAKVLRSPRLSRLAVRVLAVAPGLSRPVVAGLNRSSRVGERAV